MRLPVCILMSYIIFSACGDTKTDARGGLNLKKTKNKIQKWSSELFLLGWTSGELCNNKCNKVEIKLSDQGNVLGKTRRGAPDRNGEKNSAFFQLPSSRAAGEETGLSSQGGADQRGTPATRRPSCYTLGSSRTQLTRSTAGDNWSRWTRT